MLVIGVPSFCLALQPNTNRIKGKFLSNVAKNTVPAGLALIAVVVSFYIYQMTTGISTEVLVTMSSISIVAVGFVALFSMCKPFNWFKSLMYITSLTICILAIYLYPEVFKYVPVSYVDTLFMIIACYTSYPLYVATNKLFELTNKSSNSNE